MQKVNYIDGETVIRSNNLNEIQDEIISLGTSKQDTLVSGTNLKSVNGTSLLGPGNLDATPEAYIKSASVSQATQTLTLTKKDNTTVQFKSSAYCPFPTGFVTNKTTYEFAQSVLAHASYAPGMAWHGELTCTDLPTGLVNVECNVTAMTNTIAVIELFSSNRSPYHWEYNTASYGDSSHNGWKLVPCIRNNNLPAYNTAFDGVLECTKAANSYDLKFTPAAIKTINGTSIKGTGNIQVGTGTGKEWKEITLEASDIETLADGEQIVGTLPTAFDTTTFSNEYFRCLVNDTGTTEGTVLYAGDNYEKLYIDLDDIETVAPYLIKGLDYMMNDSGFDYNYYKTVVLYAAAGEEEPVYEGSIDSKNVVYIQDSSQQPWEQDTDNEKELAQASQSRESLQHDIMGTSYVLSIKDGNGAVTGLLVCFSNSQAAYWKTGANKTGWADIEAGKVYPVTFDTSHDTLRWLLNGVHTDSETGRIVADEITAEAKAALKTTGITFEADKFAVEIIVDDNLKLKSQCFGLSDNSLSPIFSWNEAFPASTETHYATFFGRPVMYANESFSYLKGLNWITEQEGIYVWNAEIFGENIQLVVPKNHTSDYILMMAKSTGKQAYSYNDVYRHTFTITTPNLGSLADGEYAVSISFGAVNTQLGDSSWDYILHSDESYFESENDFDWILPCSGVIGQVSSGTVTTWKQAIKIYAGYHNEGTSESPNWMRTLKIQYIDPTTGTLSRVNVISDTNSSKYTSNDFRSQIGTFMS